MLRKLFHIIGVTCSVLTIVFFIVDGEPKSMFWGWTTIIFFLYCGYHIWRWGVEKDRGLPSLNPRKWY
jgi:hypothetical protein